MRPLCARPAAGTPPSATFVYDYGERTTWLDAWRATHPMTYDLCAATPTR